MHYYKRNIGDYAKKAGRLSMLEHGAYTLLIDACYDRERFPSKEEAIEWCWARTPDEIAAVEFVLARFFTLCDNTYTQERIAEELAKYHENSVRNSKIATEREARRTERARSVHKTPPVMHEAPPNQEPLTKNHKPRTTRNTVALLPPDGVSDSTWQSFQQLRKAKRAPITPAAISGLRQEADKAGWTMEDALKECCARGWQGFKADWVARAGPTGTRNKQQELEDRNDAVLAEYLKNREAVDG